MNFTQLLPLPISEPRPLVRPTAKGMFDTVAELPASLQQVVRVQDPLRATVLSEARDRVDVYEWMVGSLAKIATIELPQDLYATDAVLAGSVVFVCGGYRWPTESEATLLARRIDGGHWVSLEMPSKGRAGKIVEALLVGGHRLIAVDDTGKTRKLFEYDIQHPERPRFLRASELAHQPGEHAECAALGEHFIAILSVAASNEEFERFLRLYDRESLQECAYTTARHRRVPGTYLEVPEPPLGRDPFVSIHRWRSLTFFGHSLLVAGGLDGVAIVDTEALQRPPQHGRSMAPAFLGEEQIHFEAPSPQCELIDVIPSPQSGGFYVIESAPSGRTARWHPHPGGNGAQDP